MQDQRRRKRGPRTHYSAAQKGNGHRRLGRGAVAGWPDHQQGGLAGWPTFKSGCLRSGSHETATILVFHNVELRRELRPMAATKGGWRMVVRAATVATRQRNGMQS